MFVLITIYSNAFLHGECLLSVFTITDISTVCVYVWLRVCDVQHMCINEHKSDCYRTVGNRTTASVRICLYIKNNFTNMGHKTKFSLYSQSATLSATHSSYI